MKVSEPTRLTREGLPGLPNEEAFDLLLKHLNSTNEEKTRALQQNLTIVDNMNAALVTLRMTHGTERTIKNPLKNRPVGIKAIRSTEINGGVRYRIADVDWRFIDPPDPTQPQQLGITAYYAPPLGNAMAVRTTNTGNFTTGVTAAVSFESTTKMTGGVSWVVGSASKLTFAKAGRVCVAHQATWNTAANGYRRAYVLVNGTGDFYAYSLLPGGSYAGCTGYDEIDVYAGDYIELYASQTSGGDLTILAASTDRCFLSARYIEPPATAQNDVTFVVYGG